jgi:SMC interacting uncharacterized protein involved in chromosome segregation
MNIQSTESKLRDISERAYQVELLMNNPILKETIGHLRDSCFDQIRSSPSKEVQEREELYRTLRVIDSFENELFRQIKEGKKAKSKLDELLSTVRKIF